MKVRFVDDSISILRSRPRRVRIATTAIIAIVAMKFLAYLWLARHYPDAFITNDGKGYLELARSLLNEGTFSVEGDPELVRTPGYPLFLAFFIASGSDYTHAVPIQIVFGVITAIFTWYIVRMAGSPNNSGTAALSAFFIVLLSPAFSLPQYATASEPFFTLLLIGGVYLFVRAFVVDEIGSFLAAIGLLGLAAYVRPISIYLVYAMLAVVAWRGMKGTIPWSTRWKMAVAMGVVFYSVIIGTWVVRNQARAGIPTFSTASAVQVYENLGAAAVARADDREFGSVRNEFRRMIYGKFENQAARARYSRQEGLKLLKEHPGEVAVVMGKGLLANALDPGTGGYANKLNLREQGSGLLGRFYDLSPFEFAVHLWQEEKVLVVLLTGGAAWMLVIWGTAGIGAVKRRPWTLADIIAVVVIVYLLVVSAGPAGHARYRVPAIPFIAYFSGFGLQWLLARRDGEDLGNEGV